MTNLPIIYMKELKSSKEWAAILGIHGLGVEIEKSEHGYGSCGEPMQCVIDPDGWDRKNLEASLEEKISKEEFIRRLQNSTCRYTLQ